MASAAPRSRFRRVLVTSLKLFALSAGDRAGRARRRRLGRGQPAAGLWRARPPRRSRPDDPGPRRRWRRSSTRWARASANGCAMTRSRRSCATRWSRSRTGASARIPASIRSASSRGLWLGLTGGSRVRGVSTITQQLARNIFLNNDRTFARKLREAILALALEWRFSKDQILELYLNRVYFGGGAYGIDAASRRFFGHSATELEHRRGGDHRRPGQGAVQLFADRRRRGRAQPRRRRARPDGAERRDHAGRRRAAADPADVQLVADAERQNSDPLFHRLGAAPARHADRRDRRSRSTSGRRSIRSCSASRSRRSTPTRPRGAQGALVTLDRDGAVRAMVGGRDYVEFELQPRHPGEPPAGLVVQAVRLSGRARSGLPARHHGRRRRRSRSAAGRPRNDSGRDVRPRCRCAPPSPIRSTPSRCGSPRRSAPAPSPTWPSASASPPGSTPIPSMALGSSEVRLIDMTRAYAAVARGGVAVTPYGIRRVTTADGTLLYQHQDDESRVLVAPWVAAQMTDLLQAVVDTGTGRAAAARPPDRGQDRHHHVEQGRLVHRLFERAHHRRLDGPRRQPRAARPRRRPRAGARLPRFHGPRRRQPAGRAVRDRRRGARLADARATTRSGSRRPTTSRWSTRTAIRSSPAPPPRRRPDRPARRGHARAEGRAVQPDRLNQDWLDRAIDRRDAASAAARADGASPTAARSTAASRAAARRGDASRS